MVETDILYAYIKKDDWLKPIANKIMTKIVRGDLGKIYASRESLHEIYYVSRAEGISIDEIIYRLSALITIDNLIFLETTYEIDLLALALMKQYNISSIFDAYYAATVLNKVSDRTIISTDNIFDNVPGIKRIDPREL
ncbi:MAG: PIN domain-containing protein [Candidatus Methanomethyliaceae archaeon]|nr:PIN domain-containing protein [Candidatus Methanomethyliaceae archaeon]MDW7970973.1 PIN domain-containing protein [Nitrososphaerota archaeon]